MYLVFQRLVFAVINLVPVVLFVVHAVILIAVVVLHVVVVAVVISVIFVVVCHSQVDEDREIMPRISSSLRPACKQCPPI